jgi:hypothetical protein
MSDSSLSLYSNLVFEYYKIKSYLPLVRNSKPLNASEPI